MEYKHFILRRLHSVLGLWLVFYLVEHLFINAQMALLFYDEGSSFIHWVNKIHDLPYLKLIELGFIAIPFLVHGYYGILYAKQAKPNSFAGAGTVPSLPQYRRNRAFTWQRLTSWLLIPAILAHVIHMRFVEFPEIKTDHYIVKIKSDPQLPILAQKYDITLQGEGKWQEATSNSIGKAFLLVLRDSFKSPLILILYTILVVAATFHGFNGLFTFLISWGITLTVRSQKISKAITNFFMWLTTLLGLAALWGTYFTLYFQGAL